MATALETIEVGRVTTGKRTIMGTDWPVESFVEKRVVLGRTRWIATYSLCNGVPSGSQEFKTKREALAAIGL